MTVEWLRPVGEKTNLREIARMNATLIALVTAAAVIPGRSFAGDKPDVWLQVRRAQREPAEGLEKVGVPGRPSQPIYLHPTVELTNADVAEADLGHTESGGIAVDITLTAEGAKKFSELTASHINRPLAFLIDGKLVCAPVILSKLSTHVQILGNFSEVEAERIAEGIVGRQTP